MAVVLVAAIRALGFVDEQRSRPGRVGRALPCRRDVVDEFVDAVQEVFPGCCIHFEDWKGTDAMRLLARYRDKVSCYSDDIQGTAGVTIAGLMSAFRITGGKLSDQRILFLGAGSAGIGIADLTASAMTQEGPSEEDARARISLFDINGLLEPSRTDLFDLQKRHAHPHAPSRDFVEVIKSIKPTAIIGVSTKGKAFTREVVEAMADVNERPIIFALSNPTDRAECTAAEALTWSKGRALYAAGVQFPPAHVGDKTYVTGQPTTCTSSPRSAWPFTRPAPSASPTRCSSPPRRPWPT
jgi:malate dehydrogenase (oxaloacetate-decarboxylating)(NADP+)